MDSLVTLAPASLDPLTEGDTQISVDIYTRATMTGYSTAGVRLGIGIVDDGTGANKQNGGTLFIVYEGILDSLEPLVVGKRYLISSFGGSDSFTNVGAAANASGCVFVATGTTPTTWDDSTLFQVTDDVAFDASPDDVQTAIRNMRAAFEGVVVLGDSAAPWTIIGADFTGLSAFRAYTDNLVPQCAASWTELQAANGLSKVAKQRIDIIQIPCAETDSATLITAGAATIVPITAGVVDDTACVLDLVLTGSPYAGAIILSNTGSTVPAVPFNPTESQVQAAIASLDGIGVGNVSVTQMDSGPVTYRYRITFAASLGDITDLEVDGSGVTFAVGRRFLLNLNWSNLQAALQGRTARTFGLELELGIDDAITTAFSQTVQIANDLLNGEISPPGPIADYLTADQISLGYTQFLSSITGLTGGTSDRLDGRATVGVAVPRLVQIVIADSLSTYLLRAGTEAESSPGIIRPDDYGPSNHKVYVQVG